MDDERENWEDVAGSLEKPYPTLVCLVKKKAGCQDNWWRGKPPETRDSR